jgi:hypothetical protein
VKTIAEIGRAARNASGMPASLQAIFDQLPVLEELLQAARDRSKRGDLANDKLESVKPILSSCQRALGEMRDLFKEACPEDESDKARRVWNDVKDYFFGKNSKLQKLLVTVMDNLKLLELKQIFVIDGKLDELRNLTEGLDPEDTGSTYATYGSGSIFSHQGSGTQKNNVSSGANSRQINTKAYQEGGNST